MYCVFCSEIERFTSLYAAIYRGEAEARQTLLKHEVWWPDTQAPVLDGTELSELPEPVCLPANVDASVLAGWRKDNKNANADGDWREGKRGRGRPKGTTKPKKKPSKPKTTTATAEPRRGLRRRARGERSESADREDAIAQVAEFIGKEAGTDKDKDKDKEKETQKDSEKTEEKEKVKTEEKEKAKEGDGSGDAIMTEPPLRRTTRQNGKILAETEKEKEEQKKKGRKDDDSDYEMEEEEESESEAEQSKPKPRVRRTRARTTRSRAKSAAAEVDEPDINRKSSHFVLLFAVVVLVVLLH